MNEVKIKTKRMSTGIHTVEAVKIWSLGAIERARVSKMLKIVTMIRPYHASYWPPNFFSMSSSDERSTPGNTRNVTKRTAFTSSARTQISFVTRIYLFSEGPWLYFRNSSSSSAAYPMR